MKIEKKKANIKAVLKLTKYLFSAWWNGVKIVWADEDVAWLASEYYFIGNSAKKERDLFYEDVKQLEIKYPSLGH